MTAFGLAETGMHSLIRILSCHSDFEPGDLDNGVQELFKAPTVWCLARPLFSMVPATSALGHSETSAFKFGGPLFKQVMTLAALIERRGRFAVTSKKIRCSHAYVPCFIW